MYVGAVPYATHYARGGVIILDHKEGHTHVHVQNVAWGLKLLSLREQLKE